MTKLIKQQCAECIGTALAPIPGHPGIAECLHCGHPNDVDSLDEEDDDPHGYRSDPDDIEPD